MLGKTQYFYNTLFKERKSSDIAVKALGKVWNLHKLILSQSPYFSSMFSGSWNESHQDMIQIEILDGCITLNALNAVFGAMYSNHIEINSDEAISVLATAALFNLDVLIGKCEEVLIESINEETVVHLYEAACRYGGLNLKRATFAWLENNIHFYPDDTRLLRQINVDLMTKLVASSELLVKMEIQLYHQLRYWMYSLLHPACDKKKSKGPSSKKEKEFFANRSDKQPFLALPEGQQFLPTFQALRTQHLIYCRSALNDVFDDNIIPKQWLNSHITDYWKFILFEDSRPVESPYIYGVTNLEPDIFLKHSIRHCYLVEREYTNLDCFGHNFGPNLNLNINLKNLTIRRIKEYEKIFGSSRKKWRFMIRVSIASINAQREPILKQTSEILSLSLSVNEQRTLMPLNSNLALPLLVSVNLLSAPPTFEQKVLSSDALPPFEIGISRNAAIEQSNTPTKMFQWSPRLLCQTLIFVFIVKFF